MSSILSFSDRRTPIQVPELHAKFLTLAETGVPSKLYAKIKGKKYIRVYYTECDEFPGVWCVNLVMNLSNKSNSADVSRGFFCIMHGDDLEFHGAREKFYNYKEDKFNVNKQFVTMKVSGSMIIMASIRIDGQYHLVLSSKNSVSNEYSIAAKTVIPTFWKQMNPDRNFQEIINEIGEKNETLICELMLTTDLSHGNTPAINSFVVHGVSACPENNGIMKFLEPEDMANRLKILGMPFTSMYLIMETNDIMHFTQAFPTIRDARNFHELMSNVANITIVGTVKHSPDDPGNQEYHIYTNNVLEGTVVITSGIDNNGNPIARIDKRKLWPYVITTMDNGPRDIIATHGTRYVLDDNNHQQIIKGFEGLVNYWVPDYDRYHAMEILQNALILIKSYIMQDDIDADIALCREKDNGQKKYAQNLIRRGDVTKAVHLVYNGYRPVCDQINVQEP